MQAFLYYKQISLYLLCFPLIALNSLQAFPNQDFKDGNVSNFQRDVDVLHYKFKIQIDNDNKEIFCENEITCLSNNPSSEEIELNLYDNLDVTEVQINNLNSNYFRKNNRIFIIPNKTLFDTFKVFVKYHGKPKRAGFDGFVFGEVNNSKIVYTINEPTFAPTWFVCDDDPADKALLDIEIINDSQFVSVSNGILESVKNIFNKKSYHYKTFYPISTYLVAVYSAPYIHYSDLYNGLDEKDSMYIEYFVLPEHFDNAKIDFADHPKMIKIFSKLFGEYPFIKEKYGVAEFLWNFGAMENQTITGVGYSFITGKNFFIDTYVHELAHHWWGNCVTPKSWDDIWLNEGFATYCEALYAEAKYGKQALISKMMSKFNEHFSGTLFSPKNLFGETVYDKGAWVLHMLRFEIGDSCFFKSLSNYFSLYKYLNASIEDFKNVCEKVYGKNLNQFFDQWIYKGEDIIKCEYSYSFKFDDEKIYCDLKMNQIQENYPEFHFPLVIKIEYKNVKSELKRININSRNQNVFIDVDKGVKDLVLDPDNNLLAIFSKVDDN